MSTCPYCGVDLQEYEIESVAYLTCPSGNYRIDKATFEQWWQEYAQGKIDIYKLLYELQDRNVFLKDIRNLGKKVDDEQPIQG